MQVILSEEEYKDFVSCKEQLYELRADIGKAIDIKNSGEIEYGYSVKMEHISLNISKLLKLRGLREDQIKLIIDRANFILEDK